MGELNLILFGPPGAGKGTQAEHLQQDFDLPYLATGDMMRAKRNEDSELGRKIARIIREGGLVDDEIVCEVLFERIEEEGDDGFLLDGFPRTIGQADALGEEMDKLGRRLTAALLIEAPDECVIERLSGRRQCSNGHRYHVKYDPPKHDGRCDQCGRALVQRDDDRPEAIRERLAVYHELTEPLKDYYEERGLLRRFDGTRDKVEVHDHIRATLATLRLEERL